MLRSALVLAGTLALSAFVAAQSPAPQSSDQRPRFEAASVKPNTSPEAGMRNQMSPGRFVYTNTRLDSLISIAYRMTMERMLGVPDWARTAKYDITATHSPEYRPFSLEQLAMLQRLLEERFALQVHTEKRDLPVYEIVKARPDGQLGPSMRTPTIDCSDPQNRVQCGTRIDAGLIQGTGVDWRIVVGQLPSAVGRPVVDKTGLSGRFDMKLEWTPDPAVALSPEAAAIATAAAAGAGADRVTIFTAMQEQLGLRLQSGSAPLDVLVIDRLERPTPD